jgi:uncharacterized repeat protein (TIGR03806 family)
MSKTDRSPVSSTGLFCFLMLLIAGCRSHREAPEVLDLTGDPPEKLSAYGLFLGNGSTQEPADGVVPYDLNSPLFSDYAAKYRFVRLPPGTSATYREDDVFEFPVGTIIAKTFAYPHDMRDLSRGQRLIETRLLIHQPDGWTGLPYMWNDEQSEATLKVAGGACDVHWVHSDGKERTVNYLIPNTNQCLACHENSKVMAPIGPKARNLNKSFPYPEGGDNQLAHWEKVGYLKGAPSPAQAPRLPVWDDPSTGTVEQRARAWLEINCAHCHNPKGPARTSGLDLMGSQTDRYKQGFWKTPIATGRGSGGRFYDIIPGKPDASILVYRIESTELGVMMPELSRRLVHEEGVALVRHWIAGMKDNRVQ